MFSVNESVHLERQLQRYGGQQQALEARGKLRSPEWRQRVDPCDPTRLNAVSSEILSQLKTLYPSRTQLDADGLETITDR